MDINAISNAVSYEKNTVSTKEEKLTVTSDGFTYESKTTSLTSESAAAVYEKSDEDETSADTKKTSQMDADTIKRMTDELEQKKAQMQSLVEKMLSKQSKTYTKLSDFWNDVKNGVIEVDPEDQQQAAEDVSDDGYWGVEQTSDRLVSFAKALAGNNTEYADKMIEAVKKGFEEATEAWGDDLPEISQKTLEATIEKLEKWRDGTEE